VVNSENAFLARIGSDSLGWARIGSEPGKVRPRLSEAIRGVERSDPRLSEVGAEISKKNKLVRFGRDSSGWMRMDLDWFGMEKSRKQKAETSGKALKR
jgi:hypothetical protein